MSVNFKILAMGRLAFKYGPMKPIYLDHAATTPIAPEVFARFQTLLEEGVANSSSAHHDGTHALALLNQAREKVSRRLGCEPSELIFTSGGTESNNWVLQRVIHDSTETLSRRGMKPHLLTSRIEHSSIVNVAEWLKKCGMAEWTELPVEADGRVNLQVLEQMVQPNTVLVSIGHGNNEIGTIQDVKAIGDLCRAKGVLFHTDSCQTFCHEPFNVSTLPVDFMSLSGHKIRAPKGIGALYVRKTNELTPLLFGGKQERGLRPGTTSVELICAFAAATELWTSDEIEKTHAIRNYAIRKLKELISGVRINGIEKGASLCHVLSFTIPGVSSKELQRELAHAGVACSTGAACGTGKSESSAVLLGLGRDPKDAHQIRISFSPTTEVETIDSFMERLTKVLKTFPA